MKIYLETERMILREFTKDDVDLLVDLDSDPQVTRYINGGRPTPREYVHKTVMPHILSYYKRGDDLGIWAAIHKKDQTFMGWFLLRPFKSDPSQTELGYRFKRNFWGNGFATEGSRALIKIGFETIGLNRVIAIADPENLASRRVMEKVGLTLEGDHVEPDGFVCVKYSLKRAEYLAHIKQEE